MNKILKVEDKLPEQTELAKQEVAKLFERYMQANTPTSFPDLCDLDESGDVYEIIDSCVPIYTWDIKVAWFLHESEIITALENEGLLEPDFDPRVNNGMTGLYAYIYNEVRFWYNNEFKEAFEAKEAVL